MGEVTPLGDGRYRSSDGASHCIAYAVQAGSQRWVFIEGMVFLVTAAGGGGRRAHATDDEMALSPPMPATVSAINVEAGQQVETGDVLVMLEAMKMELPIRAPRRGRVKALACREGELVQPGKPLIEME